MSETSSLTTRRPVLSLRTATVIILLLWLFYTALFTLNQDNTPSAFLEFLPGALGVMVLLGAGLSLGDCYLRPAPLSRAGLLFLGGSLLLMPIVWLTGRWVGWNWVAALVYAPASAISQELFFRAAVLPALLAILPMRPLRATLLHSLLFSLWHLPKAFQTAPLGGVISIALVTFAAGFLWAKQVQRDRTVFWMMGLHSLILSVNSFLTW